MIDSDDEINEFLSELARAIQTWITVEQEIYIIYSILMKGANKQLISATLHHIQSFDSKCLLLDTCLLLILQKEDTLFKRWRNLRNRLEKLNKKRNRIVHWPFNVEYGKNTRTLVIKPPRLDAASLVRGYVLNKEFDYDVTKLRSFKQEFWGMTNELCVFRKELATHISK